MASNGTESTAAATGPLSRDQQFLELVRKKLRNVSKKMQKIQALEAALQKDPNTKIEPEQKTLLDGKPVTLQLQKEFTDLQSQMIRLITEGERKEKAAASGSESTAGEQKPQRDKKQRERKPKNANQTGTPANQNQPASQNQNQEQTGSTTSQDQQKPAQAPKADTQNNQNKSEKAATQTGTANAEPKAKKEWEYQKDIYLEKYKQQFGPEHQGKFIAVDKGELFGPCNTLEELKQLQGERKNPGSFVARIGSEDDPPKRSRARGGRGGGRGGFGRGGRGGEGKGEQQPRQPRQPRNNNAPRGGAQQSGNQQ
eukprot:TRINITY_DN762_c0_g1_i2.p1 TRINITY_DN762_c0_g1~~TRINITY_DN762_c0_g1_i2.p1  ORF type:complete len:312 (-),score=102.68 TRINITY_DN762_c0_g1_i2:136-1071(-)